MSNKLKTRWAEGKATTNGWIGLPHVLSVETMASQPWDSITLDMHHGFIDLADLVNRGVVMRIGAKKGTFYILK